MATRRRIRELILLLTEQCNLSCRYCYRAAKPGGQMRAATMRRAIDVLLASGAPEPSIHFSGGEPLLAFPLLREGVLYARKQRRAGQRLQLQLSTNGTRLTPEILSFLAEQEVKVQLSFDGVAEAQRARGRGTFARLDRLLPRIRRAQPHFFRRNLMIGMVLTPETIPHLAASIEYFLAHRVGAIRLGPAFLHRFEQAPELRLRLDEQFARVTRACLRHYRRTSEAPFWLFREPPETTRPPGWSGLVCTATRGESLAIDPAGDVWSCPLFSNGAFPASQTRQTEVARFRLGPIDGPEWRERLAALPRAVSGRGVLHARSRFSSFARCADCADASTCQVCPASLLLCEENGEPGRVPDLPCMLHQVASRYRTTFRDECARLGSALAQLEPSPASAPGLRRITPARARPSAARGRTRAGGPRTPPPVRRNERAGGD